MEDIQSKAVMVGRKGSTGQIFHTPFGEITVETRVRGYKSSEGGKVFDPPRRKDELDGAEERTGESE